MIHKITQNILILINMKRFLVFLIPLLFSAQCTIQKQVSQPPKIIFGDQRLKDIHDEFIKDLNDHQIATLNKKPLRVFEYQTLGYTYWGLTFPDASVIMIDTTFMQGSKELLYVVAYHELAHFYLRAKHEEFCNLCIMQPKISKENAERIYNNIEFHKKWLLRKSYLRTIFFYLLNLK